MLLKFRHRVQKKKKKKKSGFFVQCTWQQEHAFGRISIIRSTSNTETETMKIIHLLACVMVWTILTYNNNKYISKALNPSMNDLQKAQSAAHVHLKPSIQKKPAMSNTRLIIHYITLTQSHSLPHSLSSSLSLSPFSLPHTDRSAIQTTPVQLVWGLSVAHLQLIISVHVIILHWRFQYTCGCCTPVNASRKPSLAHHRWLGYVWYTEIR